jgi:hypothetical protein
MREQHHPPIIIDMNRSAPEEPIASTSTQGVNYAAITCETESHSSDDAGNEEESTQNDNDDANSSENLACEYCKFILSTQTIKIMHERRCNHADRSEAAAPPNKKFKTTEDFKIEKTKTAFRNRIANYDFINKNKDADIVQFLNAILDSLIETLDYELSLKKALKCNLVLRCVYTRNSVE